jgi:hypothetical protein
VFQRALVAFVSVFATAEHPLVCVVDDLQWYVLANYARGNSQATACCPDSGTHCFLLIFAFLLFLFVLCAGRMLSPWIC